jgi:hypothetical protein
MVQLDCAEMPADAQSPVPPETTQDTVRVDWQLNALENCPNGVAQPQLHTQKRGNSAVIVIAVILVAVLLALGAWMFLRGEHHTAPNNPGTATQSQLTLTGAAS